MERSQSNTETEKGVVMSIANIIKGKKKRKIIKDTIAREPAMEGVSNQAELKPAKRVKRAKPESEKREFLEKYYGKDWA